MTELEKLREQIDKVDRTIIDAFIERLHIAQGVADYKITHDLPVLDRSREQEVLKKRRAMAEDPSLDADIDRLFELLMKISREHQAKQVEDVRPAAKKMAAVGTIGYQGVRGAYSDLAQNRYFGDDVNSISLPAFEDVFRAVADGEIEYGVVPIENSYAGSVGQVYDLLDQFDVKIVGEQMIHIENALLGVPGGTIKDIKEVYSHDQPFLQCAAYLKKHPVWKQIPYYNTAVSAKYVAECGDKAKAAIASEYAAEIYGLQVLKPSISTSGENTTRFIVIGAQYVKNAAANKASVGFVLKHESGALARVLNAFARLHLNMVKIESRPLHDKNFEYRFYVDFAGEGIADQIDSAMDEIKPYCAQLRLLGVYRNGEQQ
ncbi:MAG: prephenate dehydratase domain-containing protein [Christensenella sp.]|uniref:bifunctional chorismate mutase/prephenate dehydratase n=1 Tax=Christensenella sp. TaxID=1935934 RepID=UPI002B207354|nr:prephenate dehydratase domain-containing protein [Christensenella sp.]MEA5004674.1 prephenate dehydratase domain-containing protein [Christensenella sp.]